jgi:hypothetical protein
VIAGSEVSLAAGRDPRRRRRVAFDAAILGVLAILILSFAVVRSHNPQPYSGDEPHYLLVTNSLILDGDVDVKNDYLTGRYLRYYPTPIDPHVNTSIFTLDSPHWYPIHGIGLSALLVPAVVADDTDGANDAMIVIAVVVLLLAFFWVRRFTGEGWLAAVATGALGLSPFFLGLQSRIFPDLPAAALLLGCLLILEMPERRPWHLFLLGILIGVSPWFHFKNALAFGTVGVIAFVQVARGTNGAERVHRLLLLTVPALVAIIGYELAVRAWYGSWLPTRMFPPGNQAFALSDPRGIAAASFDSARGLLTNNPALMLILAGLPVWMRRWRGPFLRLALVIGPTILVQATFNDWSGGYAPPGRYALQFTPALVPAIALLLHEAPRAFRALATALLGFQWALAAAFVWLAPSWGFGGERSPFFAAIDQRLGTGLDRGMPTFDARGGLVRGGWQLAAWIVVSVMLVGYGASLSRRGISRRGSSLKFDR